MRVVLLEDFGVMKKEVDVHLPKLFAMALIKRGLAMEYRDEYLVGELCCKDLRLIDYWDKDQYVQDNIDDDTTFYFQPKKIGIYVYKKPKVAGLNNRAVDKYLHIASGRTVKVNTKQNNEHYDMIIDYSSMYSLVDNFAKDLQERGWDENTTLTSKQIKKFEH